MQVQTNLSALKTPAFVAGLKPCQELEASRLDYNAKAATKPEAMSWAEFDKERDARMNACVKLAKQQYYPILRQWVQAVLHDSKLSATAINAVKASNMATGTMTYDTVRFYIVPEIAAAVQGSASYLNVLNILKPGIMKALKDLETENLVSVIKPHRKAFGGVSRYTWRS